MTLNFQRFIITYITPVIWKYFPNRKIRTIQKFSYTEKDSGCRLMQYLILIKDPEIKKELFQHVLEEFHHADLFANLATQMSSMYSNVEIPPRSFQITADSPFKDLVSAYAYASVGESEINKDFSAYNNKRFDKKIRAVFARVASDESRHSDNTDEIFLKLCSTINAKPNSVYFWARLKRRYELYSVFMKQIGEIQLSLVLRLLYYVIGSVIYTSLQNRLVLSIDAQLVILKNQIAELEKSIT